MYLSYEGLTLDCHALFVYSFHNSTVVPFLWGIDTLLKKLLDYGNSLKISVVPFLWGIDTEPQPVNSMVKITLYLSYEGLTHYLRKLPTKSLNEKNIKLYLSYEGLIRYRGRHFGSSFSYILKSVLWFPSNFQWYVHKSWSVEWTFVCHNSRMEVLDEKYHIVSDGIINREDYTLLFENEEKKHIISVEVTHPINI